MRVLLAALIVMGFSCGLPSISANTVGMHRLTLAESGQRTRLVSIPFLRAPLALGRLDGIQVASGDSSPNFVDAQAAFSHIIDEGSYILRVTDGESAGIWFLLGEVSEDGRQVAVEEDSLVGGVDQLDGDESFAIHKLFTLDELFPHDLPEFPSSVIDLAAMQVHFYDGERFTKHWLSNGTLTEHSGWTYADEGALKDGNDIAILPGTSFLVVYPNPTADISIQINGVILDQSLVVPVYSGYNYVSVKYAEVLSGGLPTIADYLDNLGLIESGFNGGASVSESDLVYAFDEGDGTLIEGFYLDSSAGLFKPASEESEDIALADVGPGRGFVVFNRGEPYLWKIQD